MPVAGVASARSLVCMAISPRWSGQRVGSRMMTGSVMVLFRGFLRNIDKAAGLTAPQRGVVSIAAQQLIMGPLFDNPAAIQNNQPVHLRDSRQTMRDGDDRTPLHHCP